MRQLPYQGTLWVTTFLQLLALYEVRPWLDLSFGSAVVPFCCFCFGASAIIFWFFQPAGRRRPLTVAQRGLLLIGGVVLAVQTILRYVGLRYTGSLQTILGEYAGAVVGSLFVQPLAKRVDWSCKTRVLVVSGSVGYLLTLGWTAASCCPLLPGLGSRPRVSGSGFGEGAGGGKVCGSLYPVVAAVLSGILTALSRAVSAQAPLKSISRKRQFFVSYAAAALFLLPWTLLLPIIEQEPVVSFSMIWPFMTTVALGMMLAFFGDSFSVVSPTSLWHYVLSLCCLVVLELLFNMDFSPLGFLLCSVLLGLGVGEVSYAARELAHSSGMDNSPSFLPVATMVVDALRHVSSDLKSRKIAMFLFINTAYMMVEFTYGFLSNSLGLISDACHMLFDCAALAIGLYAAYIARLPPSAKFSYGYGRFEVLSGYANAVFLVLVAALIVLESFERILEPPEISTESLLYVSVGGLLVNIVGLIFFHEAHHHAHGGSCSHSHPGELSGKSHVQSRNYHYGNHVQVNQGKLEPMVTKQHPHEMNDHGRYDSTREHEHRHEGSGNGRPDHGVVGHHLQGGQGLLHNHSATYHRDKEPRQPSSHKEQEVHSLAKVLVTKPVWEVHEQLHRSTGDSGTGKMSSQNQHPDHGYCPSLDLIANGDQHAGCEHTVEHDQQHGCSFVQTGRHPGHQQGDDLGRQSHIATAGQRCSAEVHEPHGHHQGHHHHGSDIGTLSHHSTAEQCNRVQTMYDHGHHHAHHGHHHDHHGHHHDHLGHDHDDQCLHHDQHGDQHDNHGCHHDDHERHHGCDHHKDEDYRLKGEHGHHHDHHQHSDLNMEGIFLHVLADTLGSLGVVVSTILLKYKGWVLADAACSIFISVMIVCTVVPLLRSSSDILVLRVPSSAEHRIRTAMEKLRHIPGLHDCQRLHVWSLTDKELVGSLHARAGFGADKHELRVQVSQVLHDCGIGDITCQIEEVAG